MPKRRRAKEKPFQILFSDQLGIPGWSLFGRTSTIKAREPLPVHKHDGMEIKFVAGGLQVYAVNGVEYALRADDGLVFYPGEPHSSGGHPQYAVDFYWVHLDLDRGEDFLGLQPALGDPLRDALRRLGRTFTFPPVFIDCLDQCFESMQSPRPIDRQYGASLFRTLLYELAAGQKSGEPLVSPEIQRTLAYIEAHGDEKITLAELANVAALSLSRFQVRFREETGTAPREYINRIKVERAEALLREGHTITDVALTLGFSTANYFSTVFKKHTNRTPTAYVRSQSDETPD